jgi:hypothetical protein
MNEVSSRPYNLTMHDVEDSSLSFRMTVEIVVIQQTPALHQGLFCDINKDNILSYPCCYATFNFFRSDFSN